MNVTSGGGGGVREENKSNNSLDNRERYIRGEKGGGSSNR